MITFNYSKKFFVIRVLATLGVCLTLCLILLKREHFQLDNYHLYVFAFGLVYCLHWSFSMVKRYYKSDRHSFMKLNEQVLEYKIRDKLNRIKFTDIDKLEIVRVYPYVGRASIKISVKNGKEYFIWIKEFGLTHSDVKTIVDIKNTHSLKTR